MSDNKNNQQQKFNHMVLGPDDVKDNLGRVIKLQEITGKTRVAFYRALGSKDASNIGIISEYWNVMAVQSIDGRPVGSIKGLIDIEMIHSELEKSNALPLIDEWLNKKAKEKEEMEKGAEQDIKK